MSTPTLVGYDLQTRDRAPVEFGVRCTSRRRPRRPACWSSDRQRAALSGAYCLARPERLMHGAPRATSRTWHAGGGLNIIGVAYVETDEGREAVRGAQALARGAGATLRVLERRTASSLQWPAAGGAPLRGVATACG
jgi:hypothetical protein